jgi:tRNA pseudouridine38-40 synthase
VWSSERKTLLLELSYWGRYFHGVEQQGERRTVASELQARVHQALGAPLRGLAFASRTDAGVNAEQNFASGWLRGPLDPGALSALSTTDASALRIKRAELVPRAFQARSCARQKHYQYRIDCGVTPNQDAWNVVPQLDVARMRVAARLLEGDHDFSSFRASSCQARTTVRTLHRLDVTRVHDAVIIDVEGNGFLKRMVRILVGTLTAVGAGLYPPQYVSEVLAARDRRLAGITAPAEGLTLKRVELLWPGQRHTGMPLVRLPDAGETKLPPGAPGRGQP